ncbi:hypothetical protein BH23VER1_BH23VER1_37140 [soil metagenome]
MPSPLPPSSIPDSSEITSATRRHLPELTDHQIEAIPITTGGSDRLYWRLRVDHQDFPSLILMFYTDARPDNLSFLPATTFLHSHGTAVPGILGHDPERQLMWLEDLGEIDLWAFRNEPWAVRQPLYQAALREVTKIHRIPEGAVPADVSSHLQRGFDDALYEWEQGYFFDHFLAHYSSLPPDRLAALRQDPELAEMRARLASQPRFLVHRDFHSQNIIIRSPGQRAFLIDYQGLRAGRPEYDLASLLYDPYVSLTLAERGALTDYYLSIRPALDHATSFHQNLGDCACQRLMQALGAYGYLGVVKGEHAFLAHVAPAVENLRTVVRENGGPAALDAALAPGAISLSLPHSDHGSDPKP